MKTKDEAGSLLDRVAELEDALAKSQAAFIEMRGFAAEYEREILRQGLQIDEARAEVERLKALVPHDHCVVPRSLVVDVMCYGEDGKVLEPWMVDQLESALLGAFPPASRSLQDAEHGQ